MIAAAFHIPVVDIAGARSGDSTARAAAAHAFGNALEQVGYLPVGIESVASMLDAA